MFAATLYLHTHQPYPSYSPPRPSSPSSDISSPISTPSRSSTATMYEEDGNMFDSVRWDDGARRDENEREQVHAREHDRSASARTGNGSTGVEEGQGDGYYLVVEVKEPKKELEGTKECFVSYLIETRTDLPHFRPPTRRPPGADAPPSESLHQVRRRFQDFVFLRNTLQRQWPSCVVPPLPDKHRMAHVMGDRFSDEFLEKRTIDLQRFATRLARHPRLSRSSLVRSFLDSSEWNVTMHQHSSSGLSTSVPYPSSSSYAGGPSSAASGVGAHPDSPTTLYDYLPDTVLNAFTKVRKPDERFVYLKEKLDKWEEGLTNWERVETRRKGRISDMAGDYDELAGSIQGLGYLESGITDPLGVFEIALLDFSRHLRDSTQATSEALLSDLSALIHYSSSFKSVLKAREQKQLDFEELTTYLSNHTTERDRLASGYGPSQGLGGYLRDRVEGMAATVTGGGGHDNSREAKLGRLDRKITALQRTVGEAHDESDKFNEDVLAEHRSWQEAKRIEMKAMMKKLAESQIEMYKRAIDDWDKAIPVLAGIRVDS